MTRVDESKRDETWSGDREVAKVETNKRRDRAC
jgi:hypothetical protein